MIDPSALRRRATPVDRTPDRLVALAAIGIAVGFLVAALAAASLPAAARRGAWLPLHLALAGGASTAIAGVMPFFVAAFAAAPPVDVRLRAAAVATIALGAALVSFGVAGEADLVAVVGGVGYVAGCVLIVLAVFRPLGRALGPSRGVVTLGYIVALAEIGLGAVVATLYLAGWQPLLEAWTRLRPAHAWLNLVGFVSLVIGTTLLHFFATVVGSRIAAVRSARVAIYGLAAGPPVVGLGVLVASDLLARTGAIVVLVGSFGLLANLRNVWRRRARWTSDHDWHRFAIGGLVSAIAWFELGVLVAAARVLAVGAAPTGWSIVVVVGPLVVGWVGITVVASATHLVPAVGPGDPVAHARQRALLGRGWLARLAALDVGTALLSIGLPLDLPALAATGIVLVFAGTGATAMLLAGAVVIGIGDRSRASSSHA